MTAKERREEILQTLRGATAPLSASALAAQMGVSRQIVVGDVALLRASGQEIQATPRGYLYRDGRGEYRGLVACIHDQDGALRQELYTVVDNGGTIEDVIVEHPIYGELSGRLHITNRYDVECFLEQCAEHPGMLLSCMTGGVHLHTILCPDQATFARVRDQLAKKGLLYERER